MDSLHVTRSDNIRAREKESAREMVIQILLTGGSLVSLALSLIKN